MPIDSSTLDSIRSFFEDQVTYTPMGGSAETIPAVKSSLPADDFMGAGRSTRKTSFEIAYDDWPFADDPRNGDGINDGTNWRVIDITRRDDVLAWQMAVERA